MAAFEPVINHPGFPRGPAAKHRQECTAGASPAPVDLESIGHTGKQWLSDPTTASEASITVNAEGVLGGGDPGWAEVNWVLRKSQ